MSYIYDFFLFLAETLCIYGFMYGLPRRNHNRPAIVGIICAMSVLLVLRNGADGIIANPYGAFRLTELFILLYTFCMSLFDVDIKTGAYFATVVFLSEVAVEKIAAELALKGIGAPGQSQILDVPSAALLYPVCLVGGLWLVLFILKKFIPKGRRYNIGAQEILAMAISVIPVIYIGNATSWASVENESGLSPLFSYLLVSLVSLITIVTVSRIIVLKEDESERKVLEAILGMQEAQYAQRREEKEQIDQEYHDIKHHILYMANLDDPEQRHAYADEIIGDASRSGPLLCTGNESVDIVLTNYLRRCKQEDIQLFLFVEAQHMAFMRPCDIVTVLSNALSNAVEGVRFQNDKHIVVRIQGTDNWLTMHFENPSDRELAWSGNWPATTKLDGRVHGFGLKSIENIVKSYDGNAQAKLEEGIFTLNILIPMPRPNEQAQTPNRQR